MDLLLFAFGLPFLFAVALILMIHNWTFTCPRCNKPFYRDTIFWPTRTYKCLHCSLGLFEHCSAREAEAWQQREAANHEPIECMNCGQMMPGTIESCVHCGWSYAAKNELLQEHGKDEEQC